MITLVVGTATVGGTSSDIIVYINTVISSNDNLDLELHYTSNANLTELDKPEIGYTILEHLNFHNFVDVPSIAGGFKINRGVVYAKLKLEHKDEIYKFVSLYDVDFVECD